MPEVGDNYIGAEILLPRGDEMERGYVVAQSCNANENAMQILECIKLSLLEYS